MKSVERLLSISRGAVLGPTGLAKNSAQNKEQSWRYSNSVHHHAAEQPVVIFPVTIFQDWSAFPLSSGICPLEYFQINGITQGIMHHRTWIFMVHLPQWFLEDCDPRILNKTSTTQRQIFSWYKSAVPLSKQQFATNKTTAYDFQN